MIRQTNTDAISVININISIQTVDIQANAPSMVRVKVEEPQVATPPSIPTIVSAMKSHHVKGITNPTSPALSVEFDLPSRNPPISTSSKANSANSDVSRKSDLSVKSNINKTLANSKKSSSAQSDKDTGHGSNMAREVRKSKEPLPSKIGVISSQSPPPVDLRSTTPQSPPRDSSQSQETIPSAVPVRSQLKAQGISVVIKKRKLTQDERDYNRARWSGISDGGESEPDHADMTVSSPNGQVASPGTTSESSPALNLLGTEKQKTVFPMDIDEDANVTQIRKQAAKRTVGPSQKINSNEDSMEGVMPRQMAKRSGGPPRKTEASSGSWSMPKQVAKRKAGRPTNIAKQEETNNTTVKPQRKASARTAAKKHTRGAKKGGKPLIEIIMDGENDHMSIVSAEDAPGRQNSTDTHPPHFKIAAHAVTEQNLGGAPSESTADESSVANDASRTTPVDRSTTPPLPPSPSLPSTPPQISKQASYSPPVTPQRQRSSSPMISTPVNMTPPIPLLATPVRRPPPIPLLSTPMRKQAVSLLDIEYADVVVVDPTTPIRRPASRADIEDWEDEEQSESPKSHLSSPFISPSQWLFDEALTTSTPKPKRSTHVPGITPRQRVRDVIGNASAMQSSTMRSSTRRVGTYDSPQAKRTTAERQFDPATTLKQNQLIDRLEVLMQGNATSEVYAVAEQALQDEVQNLRRSQNKERRLAAQESGLGSEELPFSLDSEDKVMRTPVKQRAIDLTGLDDTPRPKTPLRGTPLATVMSALGAASRRNNQGAFSPVARKTTDILKLSDLEPLPPRSEVWQPGTSKRTDAAQNITAALKATKIKIKDSEETSETTTSTTGSLFEDVDPEERERRLFLMEETGLTAKQLSMTVEEFHRACIAEQVQALEVAAGTWIQQFDDECSRLREALLDGAGTSE
ncbi:hypothetical protein BGZ83_003565 [Gryganskiella cystojenkinii]|nr:hypothetical protein BGZ83_003565 [Gryganskiella cystojenkinii]